MKIARVFPRKTTVTPDDELCFFDQPPMFMPEVDEIHISVAFTYDLPRAEWLYKQWQGVGGPVRIGGPALNQPGGEFTPGLYLKPGNVITSRGCPNKCWFCSVHKREGPIRELEIKDGWNVRDDNLLACSDEHIKAVFEMLKRQERRPIFSGGFEAKLLKPWHVQLLKEVKVERIYCAYDTPDDYEPIIEAGKLFREAKIRLRDTMCYVLIGYPKDTFEKAEKRLTDTIKAGFMPFAMLYKSEWGTTDPQWAEFQREWIRPEIVGTKIRELSIDKED